MKKIANIADKIVIAISLCTSFILLSLKLFYSFDGDTKEYSINIGAALISIILFCGVLLVLKIGTDIIKSGKIFFISCCFLLALAEIIFCFSLVLKSNTYFSSDAGVVYNLAVSFLQGNFDAVAPKDSYLSIYPQQYGIILIFETLMRLCGTYNSLLLQLINIILVVLGSFATLGIAWELSPNRTTLLAGTILQLTFFPLFFYSPVAYGDLPGTQLIIIAIYCITQIIHHHPFSYLWMFIASSCIVLATLYKKNTMICLIAIILCLTVQMLRQYDKKICLWLIITTFLALIAAPTAQKIYEFRAGNESGPGIPMTTYIAMSMQEGLGAPGAWSGYHTNLFLEKDYNHEATSEQAIQDIKTSLDNFASHPSYAVSFYTTKIAYQWTEGTFDSISWGIGNAFGNNISPWIQNIKEGTPHSFFVSVANYHQCVIYILFFAHVILCVGLIRQKEPLSFANALLLVIIIGGFLFELIWESASRYVMMYYAMILPLASPTAATTINRIMNKFISKRKSA